MGVPAVFSEHHILSQYLSPILSVPGSFMHSEPSHSFEWSLMAGSVLILIIVIALTYRKYVSKGNILTLRDEELSGVSKILYNKYYVDEIYQTLFAKPLRGLGNIGWNFIDKTLIDGTIRGINSGLVFGSRAARLVQTGNIGFYIFAMVFGVIAILLFNLLI